MTEHGPRPERRESPEGESLEPDLTPESGREGGGSDDLAERLTESESSRNFIKSTMYGAAHGTMEAVGAVVNSGGDALDYVKGLSSRAKQNIQRRRHDRRERRAEEDKGHRLAENLENEELTLGRFIRRDVLNVTKGTINKVERAAHAGLDVVAYTKAAGLVAKRGIARRKLNRLERKAETSLFAFRRRKFERKATIQRKIVGRREARFNKHVQSVAKRHERRREAVENRQQAFDTVEARYKEKSRVAYTRKAERHKRNLERLGMLPMKQETKERLLRKRDYILGILGTAPGYT